MEDNVAWYQMTPSADGIKNFTEKFSADLTSIIFPNLRKYESIHELDLLANNPPETFQEVKYIFRPYHLLFKKLIIAKLAGSSNFEKVDAFVKEYIANIPTDRKEVLIYTKVYTELTEDLKSVDPI